MLIPLQSLFRNTFHHTTSVWNIQKQWQLGEANNASGASQTSKGYEGRNYHLYVQTYIEFYFEIFVLECVTVQIILFFLNIP